MKKSLILIISLILSISTVKANTFLTEGKTWKFNIYFDVQMKPQVPDTWKVYKGTYRYELKGDTVINGKECRNRRCRS